MIKFKLIEKEVKKFIVIFYIVGTLGFLLPYTRPFFLILTPYALLLNFFILAYFHQAKSVKKSLVVFSIIYIVGFFIEMLGVQTGYVFGSYTYGSGLGLKIAETPLLIGVNWVFMVYASASITNRFKVHQVFKVLIASSMMLVYDFILEQVAPNLDMWSWKNDEIPVQNYLGWFTLAVLFNSLLKISGIDTKNPLATHIFVGQFIFFSILFMFFDLL